MKLEQMRNRELDAFAAGLAADSAPLLLDPAIREPLPPPARAPRTPANDTRPTAPLRPFAATPQPAAQGLRMVPLEDFVWGGSGARAARVRGDHCLIRVTAGVMRIVLPMGGVDHGAGSVIFIPAGTAFAAQPQPGVQGQALLMTPQTAEALKLALPRRMVVGAGASDAFSADPAEIVERAGDPVAAATAACRLGLIAASLNRLATHASRAGASPAGGGPAPQAMDGSRELVAEFIDLAERELGRGRTIADLAEALGMTAGALDRACRTQRGQTALELVYALRLERARAMMAAGRSLPQIATDLGFTGVAHLNRVFTAATGRSAEAFRPAAVQASPSSSSAA